MALEIIRMESRKALYYGLGHLAYAVAMADGAVQSDERERLREIVSEQARNLNFEADVSEIIFQILEDEQLDVDSAFRWGMDEISKGTSEWTPELQAGFTHILEKVAAAFPPITPEEQEVIDRFKKEASSL